MISKSQPLGISYCRCTDGPVLAANGAVVRRWFFFARNPWGTRSTAGIARSRAFRSAARVQTERARPSLCGVLEDKVALLRWAEAGITAAALGYEGELGKKKAAQPMAVALKPPRWAGICDPVVWAIKDRIKKLGDELAPGASFPKRTEKDIKWIARNAWVAIKQDVDQNTADKDTRGAYNLGEEAFNAEAPKYIKEKWAKKAMKNLRDSFVKQQ